MPVGGLHLDLIRNMCTFTFNSKVNRLTVIQQNNSESLLSYLYAYVNIVS